MRIRLKKKIKIKYILYREINVRFSFISRLNESMMFKCVKKINTKYATLIVGLISNNKKKKSSTKPKNTIDILIFPFNNHYS